MELEPGDKVVANKGIGEVVGIGTVNDVGYQWRPERAEYKHTLGVDWDTSHAGEIEPIAAWRTTTVSKVPAALYRKIAGAMPATQPVVVDAIYPNIEEALARRGQVILYGPPGTGKTWAARRAAVWLLEGGSSSKAASELLGYDDRLYDRERQFSIGRHQSRQVWFMVASPSHWSWSQLFTDGTVDYSLGRLKRNFPRVRAGDLVVGYESTPTKRVVALARVTGEYDPEAPDEQALTLEAIAPVADGLTYEELQTDPVLSDSEPARFRCQGTLFALSTLEADRVLQVLTERDPSVAAVAEPSVQRLTLITFHPSYTYEDFVEGFRPNPTGAGGLELSLTDGVFKQVCKAAAADPNRRYVLLIDEINRGNIPKIFGELITLLEKDKRGLSVRLPQSGKEFAVPKNLVIIATMNTADRSIHLLDTALRRRFAFIELLPDGQPLEGVTAGTLALDIFLENLNERVRRRVGREKQIGHAIFFDGGKVVDTPEGFAAIFRHELLPLLQEYLYEDYTELAAILGPVIDANAERPAAYVDDPEALCSMLADHLGAHAAT
jgi:5-methylcytosine-specific restriction protein B